MLETNIKQFIAAARQHFFGLVKNQPEQALTAACVVH